MIQTLLIIGGVAGAITAVLGLLLLLWRILKRLGALTEGVLGKAEVRDHSGAVIEQAVPSLQARVSNLESLMESNKTDARLTFLEAWREEHMKQSDDLMAKVLNHLIDNQQAA